jgi:serine/threonine protein kinase
LLSGHHPPEVRLADFGVAVLREAKENESGGNNNNNKNNSTMQMTSHMRGTPVYCAPEMLINPYKITETDLNQAVAQSSRKTDMYAFGMLMWEVFAEKKPFSELRNDILLASSVHSGKRPGIDQLVPGTPTSVIDLIQACWSTDRSARKTAIECVQALQLNQQLFDENKFDIFLSHAWVDKPLLSQVFFLLTKIGYRVWYDQNDMGSDLQHSMRSGIENSKVVIACLNSKYQSRENCLFELRYAAGLAPVKPIVTLVIEENPFSWASPEILEICQLKQKLFVDLSRFTRFDWEEHDNQESTSSSPAAAVPIGELSLLKQGLEPLIGILQDKGCLPIYARSGTSTADL